MQQERLDVDKKERQKYMQKWTSKTEYGSKLLKD